MNRDFKGVWIPKEIYLDERLSATEKILLVEIDSLDNGKDGCWASNSYFTQFCQCSEKTISRCISHLKELGLVKETTRNGRGRSLSACLDCLDMNLDKMSSTSRQNVCQDQTKSLTNNIENNTENNPEENTLPCPDGHGVSGQAEIREEFETLWNLYPKKKGDKQSAYKSYQDSRKKGEITFDFVKDKIEQYCESIKAEKTESRYIAYGSTWFHQKRWNDDYSVILTREPTLKDVMPAIDVSNFFNKG